MALNGLFCADVLLRNYSLTHAGDPNIATVGLLYITLCQKVNLRICSLFVA